jgi:nicotinic acid mononucleotide adenylyltransferase/nicotinamide mononucleotide (NMN) deamidase PncC
MSPDAPPELIERVHASGKQLVLAITGGGSRAIASLLEVPGASATVLGAIVPYAATALERWLGGTPDNFCSERTARAMAMTAFERARGFSQADPHTLRGIGATASLATTRPKRGPHRVHVAWQSAERTVSLSCELEKGTRGRAEEELVAARLILTAVAEACGTQDASLLEPAVAAAVRRREQTAPRPWTELLLGQRGCALVSESPSPAQDAPALLFPGAFNPLHAGHERMAELASTHVGSPVTFEISIANVDKPTLDFVEMAERLVQFADRRVVFTRAPSFAEKALLFPQCVFIVGADTLSRIGDPRYYGGETAGRDAAIGTIARQGCHFLVFGRTGNGRFETLSELEIAPELRDLCEEIPESKFRVDISSTEQRDR